MPALPLAESPAYPVPEDEVERQQALDDLHILDVDPDDNFDRLTRLASRMLGMPIALISLVDHDRQWFLSRVGLDATQTSRDVAFCAHAICSDELMVVEDALLDDRFKDNPLVSGDPHIRFYAGALLQTSEGHNLGTLCVISPEPRRLSGSEHQLLADLAGLVIQHLEARRNSYLCPLTALQNRRPFFEAGLREFLRVSQKAEPLTLLLFGIDDFPAMNERFGNRQGERVLREVAETLRSVLGESALLGRLAADEFGALLTGLERQEAMGLAERISSGIALNGSVVDGVRHPLTLSCGVASLNPDDRGFTDLYRRADSALNQARLSGRAQMDEIKRRSSFPEPTHKPGTGPL